MCVCVCVYIYIFFYLMTSTNLEGFPVGASGKGTVYQYRRHRDADLNPTLGGYPKVGNGNTLQYFFPSKFHGQRSLAVCSPLGCKESTRLWMQRVNTSVNANAQTSTEHWQLAVSFRILAGKSRKEEIMRQYLRPS